MWGTTHLSGYSKDGKVTYSCLQLIQIMVFIQKIHQTAWMMSFIDYQYNVMLFFGFIIHVLSYHYSLDILQCRNV